MPCSKTLRLLDIRLALESARHGPPYAIKEIVTNALDEGEETNSDVEASLEEPITIRDYGTGLKPDDPFVDYSKKTFTHTYHHGLGLRQALTLFGNFGIKVTITSKHVRLELENTPINSGGTLKCVSVVLDHGIPNMVGTKIVIRGCSSEIKIKAKKMLNDNKIYIINGIIKKVT